MPSFISSGKVVYIWGWMNFQMQLPVMSSERLQDKLCRLVTPGQILAYTASLLWESPLSHPCTVRHISAPAAQSTACFVRLIMQMIWTVKDSWNSMQIYRLGWVKRTSQYQNTAWMITEEQRQESVGSRLGGSQTWPQFEVDEIWKVEILGRSFTKRLSKPV